MSEVSRHQDAVTGLTVTQWTNHSSNHLYFTNPGWFADGQRLLFTSDVDGIHQLATLDFSTGSQKY